MKTKDMLILGGLGIGALIILKVLGALDNLNIFKHFGEAFDASMSIRQSAINREPITQEQKDALKNSGLRLGLLTENVLYDTIDSYNEQLKDGTLGSYNSVVSNMRSSGISFGLLGNLLVENQASQTEQKQINGALMTRDQISDLAKQIVNIQTGEQRVIETQNPNVYVY